MDQIPNKPSAVDYVLAIGTVIGVNILFSVAFSSFYYRSILPFTMQLAGNIFLYFFFKNKGPASHHWAVGFLVYLWLLFIPILFFLGLLGLCALTGGN